jgi:hypothetical protein
MSGHRIVNMWSGPRNVSTAMMYAWRQRSDTTVWDEPMYGHYLVVSGADHPGRDRVLQTALTDRDAIVHEMLRGSSPTSIRFYKNMAHHLIGFDWRIIDRMDNFLLVRDPRDVLPSLAAGLGHAPAMSDTGFEIQVRIVKHILATGQIPIVVDSRELLTAPEVVLRKLCALLDVPYETAMLSWPAGPKPEDGVWAPDWYQRVHRTTAFEAPRAGHAPLPPGLEPLLEACRSCYQRLREHAITAT